MDTKFQGAKSLFSERRRILLGGHTPQEELKVFYTSYGAIKEIDVSPNSPVVVDNGHAVAFTAGLSYNVSKVGGLGSAIFGERGLFWNSMVRQGISRLGIWKV